MNRPAKSVVFSSAPGTIGKPVAACGRFVKRPYKKRLYYI